MSKRYAKQHKTPKRLRKYKREQHTSGRIPEVSIVGLGQIFPGFDGWYRNNYDEQGHYAGESRTMSLYDNRWEGGL
jgi:hypothetical protein